MTISFPYGDAWVGGRFAWERIKLIYILNAFRGALWINM